MESTKLYFLRPKGSQEFKTYHLIEINSFNLHYMYFNTIEEAFNYANNNGIKIVEYTETFKN